MQQPMHNKGSPVRLDIRHLEMRGPDCYPFGQALPHAESVVHLSRPYDETTYEQQRSLILAHERLAHPNLLTVLKVMDNRRVRRFDLFYEWVPQQLSSHAKAFTANEVIEVRDALYSLVGYLLDRDFVPRIESQLIGLVNRRTVKMLLPLTGGMQDRPIRKAELLQHKKDEINAFLNEATRPRDEQVSLTKDVPLIKSKSGSSLGSQQPSDKQPAQSGPHTLQHRNSHNTSSSDIKKTGQSSAVVVGKSSIGASTGSRHLSSEIANCQDPLTKLKHIDQRIKELEGNMKNNA